MAKRFLLFFFLSSLYVHIILTFDLFNRKNRIDKLSIYFLICTCARSFKTCSLHKVQSSNWFSLLIFHVCFHFIPLSLRRWKNIFVYFIIAFRFDAVYSHAATSLIQIKIRCDLIVYTIDFFFLCETSIKRNKPLIAIQSACSAFYRLRPLWDAQT